MTNIVTISDNSLYRIGDCILNDNDIFEGIVRNKDKFDKTFLYTYCAHMKPIINKARFSIPAKTLNVNIKIYEAAKIAANFIRSRKFEIPPQDALVVHLRLGDCFDGSENSNKCLRLDKQKILNKINSFNNKKVIIMTVYNHHYSDKSIVDSCNNKSQIFLDDLINSIPDKYEVSIRTSTNIDSDFIYLCAAKYLLLSSQSLFGQLAQKIGIILHKIAH